MRQRSYALVGLILFTFFVISFLTNIIGPLIPEIIDDFGLSLTLVALGCLTAALLGPGPVARWAFPLIGLFASVMWPVVFSLALNSVEAHHGAFSGILVTGIAGGAVVPLVIGTLGDLLGLRGGLCFLYLTFGYILSVSFWARPLIPNKTIWQKDETIL